MSNLIYTKMSLVMKDIGSIGKDQKNVPQGFKFRGIDQFVNALHPALIKHGVFVTPRCVRKDHELKTVVRSSGKEGTDKHVTVLMEYDFWAEDGSKVTVGPIPAEGLDSGDKATNKALSSALKYALIQTFSIPTEDMAEADLDTPVIGQAKFLGAPVQTSGFAQIANSDLIALQLKNQNDAATMKVGTPLSSPLIAEDQVAKKSSFRRARAVKSEEPVVAPVLGNGSTKEEDFFGN